jgi:hypothetical protein
MTTMLTAGITLKLASAKAAHTLRHIPISALHPKVVTDRLPIAGDVVLARVTAVGQHKKLELKGGRRADLFVGDTILVAYGARYAPDQFEAEVPGDLGPCQLVAAGGMAAAVLSSHAEMVAATQLEPIGLLADESGRTVNLLDYAPVTRLPLPAAGKRPQTVLVVGTSMNAGKTTVAANIVKGLSSKGLRVGAAKVTGTGAGGDTWLMSDAGAARVLDFTDGGYVSTFGVPVGELTALANALIGELGAEQVDVVVIEVADGLLQPETAGLLSTPEFTDLIDTVVFAAGDALGALAGVRHVTELGLPLRMVSGRFTAAPLAVAEARAALDLPVVSSKEFADPAVAGLLLTS